MRNFFRKNNKQKGYAILFTIVLVSAISVITAGLTNAVYKQLVLSSLARDSQAAFYQSDTATDCALYADRVQRSPLVNPNFGIVPSSWSCGGISLDVKPKANPVDGYTVDPIQSVQDNSDPCFRIDVSKDVSTPPFINTTVKAKGYNFCDLNNPRTVEREIEIKYQEDTTAI